MKKIRQKKIVELIENHDIETQEELAERLRQSGFEVTQATVSRDIRELKLSKVSHGKNKSRYVIFRQDEPQHVEDKYIRVLKDGFVSVDVASKILVVRTGIGMAMAVAMALDALKLPEILGCIAGDDTIMVAVRDTVDPKILMDKIHALAER